MYFDGFSCDYLLSISSLAQVLPVGCAAPAKCCDLPTFHKQINHKSTKRNE